MKIIYIYIYVYVYVYLSLQDDILTLQDDRITLVEPYPKPYSSTMKPIVVPKRTRASGPDTPRPAGESPEDHSHIDAPRDPIHGLIKEYGVNYIGMHNMV